MIQEERFKRWVKRQRSNKKQYLAQKVIDWLLPEFYGQKFISHPEFTSQHSRLVGVNEIILQRREGEFWPTVHIYFFTGAGGHRFRICFSILPSICTDENGFPIPRNTAPAQYGLGYYFLIRPKKYGVAPSEFGFNWLSLIPFRLRNISNLICYNLNWKAFLDSEVRAAKDLLPALFDLFNNGTLIDIAKSTYRKVPDYVQPIPVARIQPQKLP